MTGIGNGELAPTDMHATEVRLCVAVSSMIRGQRCIIVEFECVLGSRRPCGYAARTLHFRHRFVFVLVRILRSIDGVSTRTNTYTQFWRGSNGLGYLHYTPLQPPEFYLWYSLPSLKVVLVEPRVKLVPRPDESYRWSGTCRRIQWVVGALVVFSSTRLSS